MSPFLVVALILLMIITMGIINIITALKCPDCKKLWALTGWNEIKQSSICKFCAWESYAKNFTPPKTSYLKFLEKTSPFFRNIKH